jgi:xanthine dehydrogenase accessory factor
MGGTLAIGSGDEPELPLPRGAEPSEVLRVAAELADGGVRVVMATVLARRGSTPSTPGQKLLLADDGACVGTIGGGALEREALLAMRALLEGRDAPASRVQTWKLGAELGMCCGGGVDVLFELITSATPLLCVGAGHIGAIAAPLLSKCGFSVTLVDEREGVLDEADSEPKLRRMVGDFEQAGRLVRKGGAVLAMTHDHQLDQRVIEWALREGYAFVGGVGSRAKRARTDARLEAKGFPEADRARVRMPLGLSIGARSPHEIAVSIVAEMIAWRRDA